MHIATSVSSVRLAYTKVQRPTLASLTFGRIRSPRDGGPGRDCIVIIRDYNIATSGLAQNESFVKR